MPWWGWLIGFSVLVLCVTMIIIVTIQVKAFREFDNDDLRSRFQRRYR